MALFINNEQHPDVFINNVRLVEPNQKTYKHDFVSELMAEQKREHDLLQKSLQNLKNAFIQQEQKLEHQNEKVGKQLKKIGTVNLQHKEFENQIVNWMGKLESESWKQQELLADSLLVDRELADKIETVSHSNQEIVRELENQGLANERLSLKMDEQTVIQKKIANEIVQQKNNQNEIISRLDNQEALTEKMLRQIDYFRSILYERTHFLGEKIENGYKITSSYIYKLMKNPEKPITHYMANKKGQEDD